MSIAALRIISVEHMLPDPDVQLEFSFSERRAHNIATSWSDEKVGVLAVAPLKGKHSGKYGIIDGRHRHAGALLRGAPHELRCDVLEAGLSPAEKAAIKLGRDRDRRVVKRIESFLEEVIVGDPTACEIKRITEQAGFKVGKVSGGKPYDRIEAVKTLEGIHSHGLGVLRRTLVLNTTWKGEPGTNTGLWLGGVARFVLLGYDESITPNQWKRLANLVPAKVRKIAVGEAQTHVSGSASVYLQNPVAYHIAEQLRKAARVYRTKGTP